jgi:hypothetical protein
MRRGVALGAAALLLAGCAGSRTPVAVAVSTADGSQHYEGRRTLGGTDRVALTSETGATCAADLHETREVETDGPAAFGGVRCDDGRIGMLVFSGAPNEGGGAVNGVMNRRKVSGGWGTSAARGAGA